MVKIPSVLNVQILAPAVVTTLPLEIAISTLLVPLAIIDGVPTTAAGPYDTSLVAVL